MKKLIQNTFLIVALGGTMVGCKDNNANKTNPSEAKEAAMAKEETISFKVDTAASVIEWQGEKPTRKHTGTIKIKEGTFKANDSAIESGSFVIDMASIEVTDLEGDDKASLENHLKGTVEGKEGDFFNTTEHPLASFEVTGFSKEEGKTMLQGNLTIKEETKNISFPVDFSEDEDSMEFTSENFTIDRTNWNVNYGSKSVFEGLGDKFISDEVQLKVSIKANKA